MIKPSDLQFFSLPEELQVEILMHMDYRSLLRCTLICKSLNHIIKECPGIQYIIELGASGMEAVSCTLSQAELLQKLRNHCKAWDRLDLKEFRVILSGDFTELRAHDLVAGTFSTSNGSDLCVIWLPSAIHEGRTLCHETLGLSIRDFAIDPTEDVIVFLEEEPDLSTTPTWNVRLHIRTISSNSPHPLAQEGTLSFDISQAVELEGLIGTTLQLAYDMLFLSIDANYCAVKAMAWNWKTGCLIFDSGDPAGLNGSQTFIVLNSETFVLLSATGFGSFKVYTISHCERSPATLIATLHLPELQQGPQIQILIPHSGPVHANPPENSSFTSSLESRIQVISAFYYDVLTLLYHTYSIFIHTDHLLHIAKSCPVDSDLSWPSWGPQHTRFLPRSFPTDWPRYVHGQRVIRLTPDSMQVLNFARSIHAPSPGAHEIFLRSNPSCIPKDSKSIFVEDVVTNLPYYTVNLPIKRGFFTCMIDEERIIGLRTTSLEHIELYLLAV